jgi:hypothetical protein
MHHWRLEQGLLLAAVKGGEDGRPSLLQEEGAFSKVRMGREGALAGRREERRKGAISINRERRRRGEGVGQLQGEGGTAAFVLVGKKCGGEGEGLLLVVYRRREWMDKVNGGENNYKG